MHAAGGTVQRSYSNGSRASSVRLLNTNDFLQTISSDYEDRWRNLGLTWAYIVFNVLATLSIYWLARVPKSWSSRGLVTRLLRNLKDKRRTVNRASGRRCERGSTKPILNEKIDTLLIFLFL